MKYTLLRCCTTPIVLQRSKAYFMIATTLYFLPV